MVTYKKNPREIVEQEEKIEALVNVEKEKKCECREKKRNDDMKHEQKSLIGTEQNE